MLSYKVISRRVSKYKGWGNDANKHCPETKRLCMNNRRRLRKRIFHKTFDGVLLTNSEVCNLCRTLAKYIAYGLRQFEQKEILSLPYSREHFSKDAENETVSYTWLTEKHWRNIIKEMIWTFDQIAVYAKGPSSMQEFEKYIERRQNGLDLFAKYFRDLFI